MKSKKEPIFEYVLNYEWSSGGGKGEVKVYGTSFEEAKTKAEVALPTFSEQYGYRQSDSRYYKIVSLSEVK